MSARFVSDGLIVSSLSLKSSLASSLTPRKVLFSIWLVISKYSGLVTVLNSFVNSE